jgi:hypothetical protein
MSDEPLSKEIAKQKPKAALILDEERIDEMLTLFEYDRAQLTAVFDMQQEQKKKLQGKHTPEVPESKPVSAVEDVPMQPQDDQLQVNLESVDKQSKEPELTVELSAEPQLSLSNVVKSEGKDARPLSLESASENVVIAKSEIVKAEETEAEKIKREIALLEQRMNEKKEFERLKKEREEQEKAERLLEETRRLEAQQMAQKMRLEEELRQRKHTEELRRKLEAEEQRRKLEEERQAQLAREEQHRKLEAEE